MFPSDELIIASPSPRAMDNLGGNVQFARTKLKIHPAINAIELPIIAKRSRADWILSQNFAPVTGRSATFVHDFLFASNPEWFSLKERAYLSLIPRLLPLTSLVLTSSRSEADRIAEFAPRTRQPVPVGLGVSTALKKAFSKQPKMELTSKQFALVVGRINVRKNLSNLIEGALKSHLISTDYPLVVVGQESGRTESLSTTALAAIGRGEIVMTGYVPDTTLRWLYENCDVMCFPSIAEGFGLPPIEAAYFGAKVLVSDIPVMRENLHNRAHYVNPLSIESIACGLQKIRDVDALRTPGDFDTHTWENVVINIRAAFEQAGRSC